MKTISPVSDEAIEQLTQERLLLVESQYLIERYNRALSTLCGFTTHLERFHIDCSGYSPEIAKECGDPDYLNVNGINKKFILVSVHQQNYPVVRQHFSSSVLIIKAFIRQNFNAIVAITARDALFGELENNIIKLESLKDLLTVRQIDLVADTPGQLISNAKAFIQESERLMQMDDAGWVNPSNFTRLVALAEKLDIDYPSTIIPTHTHFEQSIFFSKHFGGIYVFQFPDTNRAPVAIALNPKIERDLSDLGVRIISIEEPAEVYHFLKTEGFIERLTGPALQEARNRLKNKQKRIILELIFTLQRSEPRHITDTYLKHFIEQNFSALPSEFHELQELGKLIDREESTDHLDTVFYTCKVAESEFAEQHATMINHLISVFTPHSHIRCFAYNRDLFRDRLRQWRPAKQKMIMELIEENQDLIEELDKHAHG